MNYTPTQRLTRIWAMAQSDPDCSACQEEVRRALSGLEDYLSRRTPEDSQICAAAPICIQTYFGRVLELVSRELRFPEEE